jgi:chromosome segregation ATPase
MELLDLITVKQEIPGAFPDQSLYTAADEPDDKNEEHQKRDPARREWLERDYLRGYLTLFKLQYDEVVHILKMLEDDYKKTKKANRDLTKEIKRLNDTLQAMQERNNQLDFDFKLLKKGVETLIKNAQP